MALDLAQKQEVIRQFGRKEGDTGSTEVQIALISARIKYLTEHLKINKKVHSSRLGLLKLVGKRKRLLRYLKKRDYNRYKETITTLSIRDKS